MHKYRIVHIHSDPKFIDNATAVFEGPVLDNVVVVLGTRGPYQGIHEEDALYCRPTVQGVSRIVEECKSADLVVLYDLDFVKCVIANRLPDTVRIAWRFFGYELYGRILGDVLSESSSKHRTVRVLNWTGYLHKLVTLVAWRTTPGREFNKAVWRIDFFLGLAGLEYSFLRQYWPDLPEFVQLPISGTASDAEARRYVPGEEKSKCVIVGNSRSIYNNHLDVLEVISSVRHRDGFTWYLWFNYGAETRYTMAVREAAGQLPRAVLVETFLPIEEFREVYRKAAAFVMNSYRQLAMANIFEALRNGVKVYLSRKNVMFDWFQQEGFIISSVEELATDIENDDVSLSRNAIERNLSRLAELRDRYSVPAFQKEISRRIERPRIT